MKPKSFRDLKVWQLAHNLSLEVSELTKTLPREERYRLSDQMIRSARSVPANISEGFRRFHFNDKLTFYERSLTSLDELDNHFSEAIGNKFITDNICLRFNRKIKEISFLLNKMMSNIIKARNNDTSSQRLNSSRRLDSSQRLNPSPRLTSKPKA